MLSFMVLVVVHSSQLYRKIHSANTLKWRIFCDNVSRLVNLRFDPKQIATKRFLMELSFTGCIK